MIIHYGDWELIYIEINNKYIGMCIIDNYSKEDIECKMQANSLEDLQGMFEDYVKYLV